MSLAAAVLILSKPCRAGSYSPHDRERCAAFFETYSTFRALPSLFLEDLFVCEDARGQGIGESLLRHLARLAVERGCGRLEWSVLDWNVKAQHFYRACGASLLEHRKLCRVDGDALLSLAR